MNDLALVFLRLDLTGKLRFNVGIVDQPLAVVAQCLDVFREIGEIGFRLV